MRLTTPAQGCYDWMAEQLDAVNPKRVFDIGCGTGEGLLSLRRRFESSILSIDENSYCLRQTAALLRASEAANFRSRNGSALRPGPMGDTWLALRSTRFRMSREVMLLQGDLLLADEELFRFIAGKGPFDAVTLWLIGTWRSRSSCVNLDDFKMQNIGDYRLHVQNKAYNSQRASFVRAVCFT